MKKLSTLNGCMDVKKIKKKKSVDINTNVTSRKPCS